MFSEIIKDLGVSTEDLRNLNRKIAKENGLDVEELSEDAELAEMEIKIEKHGEMLYAFKLDDDAFLGQGRDRETLIERLNENLSNVKLIISKENGAEYVKVK